MIIMVAKQQKPSEGRINYDSNETKQPIHLQDNTLTTYSFNLFQSCILFSDLDYNLLPKTELVI